MTATDERALEAGARAVLHRRIKPDFFEVKDGAWTLDHDKVVAEAAIMAYLQALRPGSTGGEGWQPIETAPKDGTEILVCGPDTNGGTYRDVQRWPENWSLKWPVTYMAYAAGEPTHWRPLPEPPSAMLAAAGGENG